VTNNTARNVVIPVAQSIVETFHKSNIEAKIVDKYTRELSHVGTMNPRVKGFKARHMEYTIKVWRH
jgi:predicted transcriptional regulator